jgi:hypothetical protein
MERWPPRRFVSMAAVRPAGNATSSAVGATGEAVSHLRGLLRIAALPRSISDFELATRDERERGETRLSPCARCPLWAAPRPWVCHCRMWQRTSACERALLSGRLLEHCILNLGSISRYRTTLRIPSNKLFPFGVFMILYYVAFNRSITLMTFSKESAIWGTTTRRSQFAPMLRAQSK